MSTTYVDIDPIEQDGYTWLPLIVTGDTHTLKSIDDVVKVSALEHLRKPCEGSDIAFFFRSEHQASAAEVLVEAGLLNAAAFEKIRERQTAEMKIKATPWKLVLLWLLGMGLAAGAIYFGLRESV